MSDLPTFPIKISHEHWHLLGYCLGVFAIFCHLSTLEIDERRQNHRMDQCFDRNTDNRRTISAFFRSWAYSRKGSLEVTFLYVRMSTNFAKLIFHFFVKLNYGTHHMTIYGTRVNQKWNVRDLQVQGACVQWLFLL